MKSPVFYSTLVYICILTLFAPTEAAKAVAPLNGEQGIEVRVIAPLQSSQVLPWSTKLPESTANKLHVRGAFNEYEPASFVISTTNMAINDIVIEAGEITNATKASFGGKLDVKIVKVWYQGGALPGKRGHAYIADNEPRLVPELLLNDDSLIKVDPQARRNYVRVKRNDDVEYVNIGKDGISSNTSHLISDLPIKDAPAILPFSLNKGESRQVLITVEFPGRSSAPGEYHGNIIVKAGTVELLKLPLTLELLPFALERSNLVTNVYYRSKLSTKLASISSEFKNENQMRAELLDLKSHGITNPPVYQKLSELGSLREELKIRKDLGMTDGPLYYLGLTTAAKSEEGIATTVESIEEMKKLVSEFGYSELYIYGVDEAKGEALIAQIPTRKAAQQAGAKILVAGYAGHFETIGKLTNALVLYGNPPDVAEIGRGHSLGAKVFSYQEPQSGPEDPTLFRYRYGILLWQLGFDGSFCYAYQHAMNSIWNDFDHDVYRDHAFTYPTSDGVISTLAWESFREAIDDLRYIATLESLVGETKLETGEIPAVVAEGKKYLAGLKKDTSMQASEIRGKLIDHIGAIFMWKGGEIPSTSLRLNKAGE